MRGEEGRGRRVRGRTDRFDRAKKLGRSKNALGGGRGEETTERAGNEEEEEEGRVEECTICTMLRTGEYTQQYQLKRTKIQVSL